jgi:glycosyltransferase involved in cell wall biosynthesis
VIEQSNNSWELILVDDGSTDGAEKAAVELAGSDPRISLIVRSAKEPKGASSCRNIGAGKAKGDYLLFLDSDDLLAPYAIQQRVDAVKNKPDAHWIAFPMLLFKEDLKDMRILMNVKTAENDLDRFLKRENVWTHPLWKKEFFIKALGGFDPACSSFQDWELNVRALIISDHYDFLSDIKPDYFYRQHENTISTKRYSPEYSDSLLQMLIKIFKLLKQSEKMNEERRNALAGFFTDVVLRYRFSDNPSKYVPGLEIRLKEAVNAGLVKLAESHLIYNYFKFHTFKIAYRSALYRKLVDKLYRNNFLRAYYVPHVTNQLKHSYNGEL